MNDTSPDINDPRAAAQQRAAQVRVRVLAAVSQCLITRNGETTRWWTSDTTFRELTPAEYRQLKKLRLEGVIRFEPGEGFRKSWPVGAYWLNPGGAADLSGVHDSIS